MEPDGSPKSLTLALMRMRGLPALEPQRLRQWLIDENVVTLTRTAAEKLAQEITLVGPEFSLEQHLQRPSNRSPRNRAVGAAIWTLYGELPGWIADHQQFLDATKTSSVRFGRLAERSTQMASLQNLVDRIVQEGMFYENKPGPGRRHSWWHPYAHFLAPHILEALTGSGVKRVGFSSATAPAVRILKAALDWLGNSVEPDAVVKAMKKRRTPKGNKPT